MSATTDIAGAPRGRSAISERVAGWINRLFAPIDIASIAVFRIGFGALLFLDLYEYFWRGWIKLYFIEPTYFFAYFGFDFIRPLPGVGMHALFCVLLLCTILITVGLFYRLAMATFFLGFSYVFLLDEARYLNHFYLVILIAFLMIFVPAARGWSLDALIARRRQDSMVPGWSLWILRAQVEIMLIYAGLVKLNADWLQGEPLGVWLAGASANLPIFGPLFLSDTVGLMSAWGAVLLHLIGAPMLLFKSTRKYAFAAYCVFHVFNSFFFTIKIFPWLTIAATLLFFDPDWPRQVWRNLTRWLPLRVTMAAESATPARKSKRGRHAPANDDEKRTLFRVSLEFGKAALKPDRRKGKGSGHKSGSQPWNVPGPFGRAAIVTMVVAWTIFQIWIPARHLRYPGDTSWHEQGHTFAWQMMLRQKIATAKFYVRDPDSERAWIVNPRRYLSKRQTYYMTTRPAPMRQFARYLEKVWAERHGTRDVEIRAFTAVALNGRRAQALVDPTRDLTEISYSFGNSDWILPLTEPMPPKAERWQQKPRKALLGYMKADPEVNFVLTELERSRNNKNNKK